jgi:hypothetical protein
MLLDGVAAIEFLHLFHVEFALGPDALVGLEQLLDFGDQFRMLGFLIQVFLNLPLAETRTQIDIVVNRCRSRGGSIFQRGQKLLQEGSG